MSQLLVGHDVSGNIRPFDRDGDLTGGDKMGSVFFLNFSRLLVKDEIKKGSFEIKFITGSAAAGSDPAATRKNYGDKVIALKDHAATSSYKVNSPAGEYGILYTSSATPNENSGVGLVYYQAGICVLTASVFTSSADFDNVTYTHNFDANFGSCATSADTRNINTVLSGTAISASADGFRARLINVEFNNTTELNSTVYFCRAHHNEFNYSTNPTYQTGSNGQLKHSSFVQNPQTYITTVGLYNDVNELLAVAKLSKPLLKNFERESTIRVKLYY